MSQRQKETSQGFLGTCRLLNHLMVLSMNWNRNIETQKTAAGNKGLAKVAVQCSADTFVVNQSLVLRINICSENRHLRQARNRWQQV
jgi:hypothetical protein